MKDHQTTLALDSLKSSVEELQQQVAGLKHVVESLLDKAHLDPGEKEDLLQSLVVETVDEVDEVRVNVVHKKSIQDLLDESQGNTRNR